MEQTIQDKIREKLLETTQKIGLELLIESVNVISDTLQSTECSLWSINCNSTRNPDTQFNSASLIYRKTINKCTFSFEKDTDYVHELKICFFKKAINDCKNENKSYKKYRPEKKETENHLSFRFLEELSIKQIIVIPIWKTNDKDTPIAILDISFNNVSETDNICPLDEVSPIIQSYLSTAFYRYSLLQKQNLMQNIVTLRNELSDKDINTFHDAVLKKLRDFFPCESASYFTWDSYQNRFELTATTSSLLKAQQQREDIYYLYGEGLTGGACSSRRITITDDIKAEFNHTHHGKYREVESAKTAMFVPLPRPTNHGEIIGVLRFTNKKNICNPDVTDYFNDEDASILEFASNYISLTTDFFLKEESQYNLITKMMHEFYTPAQSIVKTADRILRKREDFEFQKTCLQPYLENIISFATFQKWQATSVLYPFRHRQSQFSAIKYNREKVNLKDILYESKNIIKTIARNHNVRFDNIIIYSQDLYLFIDRIAFVTVFYNLFTNAIKYSGSTYEDFYLSTEYYCTDYEIIIRVKDRGIGIEEDEKDLIFQTGFRSNNAIKINAAGFGMGLPCVRQIIRDFGGEIKITSCKNPTTFEITLPIKLKPF